MLSAKMVAILLRVNELSVKYLPSGRQMAYHSGAVTVEVLVTTGPPDLTW